MILLGCKPIGRHTEQHDIFFAIGNELKDTIPDIKKFWKDSGQIHIDCWRKVTEVDGYKIEIISSHEQSNTSLKLFFINLGGYKPEDFEEYHYKMIVVAKNKSMAIKKAKETAFFQHTGFKGASSHIDDKYGIDVDDLYEITDILPDYMKNDYKIHITESNRVKKDKWQIGYTNLSKVK